MASMHTLSASTAGPEGDTTPVADMVDQKSLRRIVMASVAGNALEWYDFFLYSTAAALVFGELFFRRERIRSSARSVRSPVSRSASPRVRSEASSSVTSETALAERERWYGRSPSWAVRRF